jgi:uncharacterized protein involved in exopolysaccharide biosynthesis
MVKGFEQNGNGADHNGNGSVMPAGQPPVPATTTWRNKVLLVVGVLVGLGTGAAIAWIQPPVYQSTAQISIVKRLPEGVADTHQSTGDLAPPAEVLRSSQIIESAIRSPQVASRRTSIRGDADPVASVRSGLAVVSTKTPSGQGNLFQLSYRGKDGADSQTILLAVLESYTEFLRKKHQEIAGDTLELLLREQEKVRKELAAEEAEYRSFREQAPLLGRGRDGLELKQDRFHNIQSKRSALLLQKVEAEGHLAAAEAALKDGRPPEAVLYMLADYARTSESLEPGQPRRPSLQEQLTPLLLAEKKLLELHPAKHPEVAAVHAQIEATRRLFLQPPSAWVADQSTTGAAAASPEEQVRVYLGLLRQQVARLKTSEELLAAVFEKEQDEARRLASYEIRNEAFQSAIALKRQLNESLVKRLNDVSLIRSAGGYQVEVIEPPSEARRVGPSLPLYLCAGAFLGLVVGKLLASVTGGRTRSPAPGRASPRSLHPTPALNHSAVPSEVVT